MMNDTTHEAEDVIGSQIFNPHSGMGLGVAVERKIVRNGYGDTRDVFVCLDPDGNETLRDVADVIDAIENRGYQLCEDPWGLA